MPPELPHRTLVRRSITLRLLLAGAIIVSAFLGLAGLALDLAYRHSTETALQARAQAHVYTLLAAAKEDKRSRLRLPELLAIPDFDQPDSGLYAQVHGENGTFHWSSASLLGRDQDIAQPIPPGQTRWRAHADLAVLDQGIAWDDIDGRPIPYTISVAVDRAPLQAEQSGFRRTLMWWLGGAGLLLLLSQLALLRWGLAPLHRLADQIKRIEDGQQEHLTGPVPSELSPLTGNLNALIHQANARQERTRNSLADLAHSIKTPLSVLRSAAEQSKDPTITELVIAQTERIDQVITYHRQRAAVAGTLSLCAPLAIAPVADRLCAGLAKLHAPRGVRWHQGLAPAITARIEEGDLFELLGNLLENAFRHCTSRVQIDAQADMHQVHIMISDDGPGIAADDVPRLLRRGERADQHHPGQGIGLAVVDQIVHQYGGSLRIQRSVNLGGVEVRVSLPI